MRKTIVLTVGIACCGLLMARSAMAEEAAEKSRIYADPEGRFSFRLSGDWIKLRADGNKGIAGSFVLTKKVGEKRKVVAELLISQADLKPPVSLLRYVRDEDRRVMNTPGFTRIVRHEEVTLGEQPALRNRYALSRQTGPQEQRNKLVYQYYALKEDAVWGITLSGLRQDEPTLGQVERLLISSFQFSVPEDAEKASLNVFKEVSVTGAMGGFSLTVPEAWEVSQSEEEGATFRGPGAVVYAFSAPCADEKQSPEDSAGIFLKERENLKDLRVLSQGTEEVAGLKGYVVEYSGVGEGRGWRVRLTTFSDNKKAFFVYFVSTEEGWNTNKEILSRIVQSFSVTPQPGESEKTD